VDGPRDSEPRERTLCTDVGRLSRLQATGYAQKKVRSRTTKVVREASFRHLDSFERALMRPLVTHVDRRACGRAIIRTCMPERAQDHM
jgi:hypothetical protein